MSTPSASAAPLERRSIWGMALIVVFLFALYLPTLLDLAKAWNLDQNYSHGFFVLPISLWLAWLIVRENPLPAKGDPGIGAVMMGFGLVAHLICVVLRYPPIDFVSLMFVLRGVALVLGGTAWANLLLFPTFFLFFLFPLPQPITQWIAITLQDLITPIAVEIFGWFYDCTIRGNNIRISLNSEQFADLYVAQACSGIRQLMMFVAMATLVAHFGKLSWLRGAILTLLAVPVAIAANVVRVVLMGVVTLHFGSNWLSTWMHDLPALLTVPLGIAMFFGLVWVISPDEKPQPREPAA